MTYLKPETKEVLERLTANWQKARDIQNRAVLGRKSIYDTIVETVNGTFSWNNQSMVMLCDFIDGGGYESYGSIVGLRNDGVLVWEYQSHCSCNDFGDSTQANELLIEDTLSKKSCELNSIPDDWEDKIYASAKKLLEAIN